MSSKRLLILITALGFLLWANTLPNKMFWDDDDFILNNQFIKNWRYAGKYFSENVIAGAGLVSNYWRPLLLMVFSLEWHLWEDWMPPYHLVNTSFHTASAALLFLILNRLLDRKKLAFFTALFFLVHPVQTEAVAYVNSLGDSLSVFFMLSGIWLYLKTSSDLKRKTHLSAAYVLALMSKETAIILPALIAALELWFLNKGFTLKEKFKTAFKKTLPLFAIALLYLLLRATALNFKSTFNFYGDENPLPSIYLRFLTFLRTLFSYLQILFAPFNLHMERSVELAANPFSLSIIAGGIFFLACIFLILLSQKTDKMKIVGFGLFWFLTGLAPTSNILVPINSFIYEHWLYLPLPGFFLAVLQIGFSITSRYKLRKIFFALAVIWLAVLGALTVKRNADWRDPINFYEKTLRYSPRSYRLLNNLGKEYAEKGLLEKAEENYKKAVEADSENPVAYHNLGNLYKTMNRKELAAENFKKALGLDPDFIFSRAALLNLYREAEE